jgi:hypothetical protein
MSARHAPQNIKGSATGNRFTKMNRPPEGTSWCWLTADMLASPAWRALTGNAMKIVMRIALEHLRHGGVENGKLPVASATTASASEAVVVDAPVDTSSSKSELLPDPLNVQSTSEHDEPTEINFTPTATPASTEYPRPQIKSPRTRKKSRGSFGGQSDKGPRDD